MKEIRVGVTSIFCRETPSALAVAQYTATNMSIHALPPTCMTAAQYAIDGLLPEQAKSDEFIVGAMIVFCFIVLAWMLTQNSMHTSF